MDEFKKYADRAIERGERKLAKRIMIERRICFALVKQVLADGHALSVFDSEDWTVKSSRDEKLIREALFTTDSDELVVRDLDNKRLGWFQLIYGNDGYDVISDYTANEYCNSVYDRLEPMITKMETTA
jgi:hypothetical protein